MVALGQSDMGGAVRVSAATSPQAAVVMLHRSRGRDRTLGAQVYKAHWVCHQEERWQYIRTCEVSPAWPALLGITERAPATRPPERAEQALWRPQLHASLVSPGWRSFDCIPNIAVSWVTRPKQSSLCLQVVDNMSHITDAHRKRLYLISFCHPKSDLPLTVIADKN